MNLRAVAASLVLFVPACDLQDGAEPQGGTAASVDMDAGSDPDADEVTINGVALDDETHAQIEAALYADVPAGAYWYDARSGLGGPWGAQATVFAPGFDFGPVAADASAGTTAIFYNGRELPYVEAAHVAWLFGIPAENIGAFAGRYILEANGDVFTEAGQYLGNLAAAAAAQGGGGSSDGCTAVRIPSSAPNPTGVPQTIDVATGTNC